MMLGCDTVVSTAISRASFMACRSCCRAYMTCGASEKEASQAQVPEARPRLRYSGAISADRISWVIW